MIRMLVVDDEVEICKVLSVFFTSKNYKVFTAVDGMTALKLVKEVKPQVVLLDIIMKGMNGIDVLKQIKKIDPDIGVTMITGMGDEELASRSLQEGAFDCVIKPFKLDYIESMVSTMVAFYSLKRAY